jgi:hypothetical protein
VESFRDRKGPFQQAAQSLGDFIDNRIVVAGGDVSDIAQARREYSSRSELLDALTHFRETLEVIVKGWEHSKAIYPKHAMEDATASYATLRRKFDLVPSVADHFPDLRMEMVDPNIVGYIPFSKMSIFNEGVRGRIGKIDEFTATFGDRNVMEAAQDLWRVRTVVCHICHLEREADVCREVAESLHVSSSSPPKTNTGVDGDPRLRFP